MAKLLLISILFAFIVIPTRAARDPNPMRGLRNSLVRMLVFEVIYALALLFLWGRLG